MNAAFDFIFWHVTFWFLNNGWKNSAASWSYKTKKKSNSATRVYRNKWVIWGQRQWFCLVRQWSHLLFALHCFFIDSLFFHRVFKSYNVQRRNYGFVVCTPTHFQIRNHQCSKLTLCNVSSFLDLSVKLKF